MQTDNSFFKYDVLSNSFRPSVRPPEKKLIVSNYRAIVEQGNSFQAIYELQKTVEKMFIEVKPFDHDDELTGEHVFLTGSGLYPGLACKVAGIRLASYLVGLGARAYAMSWIQPLVLSKTADIFYVKGQIYIC